MKRGLCCCLVFLGVTVAVAAPKIKPVVSYGKDSNFTPPKIVMHILFKDEKGRILSIKWQGLATKAESYHVTETLNDKKTPVAIEAPTGGAPQDGFVKSITLTFPATPKKDATYSVEMDPGVITLQTSEGDVVFTDKLPEPPKNQLPIEVEFLGGKNFENKIELAGGTGGGVLSARAGYSVNSKIENIDAFQRYGWEFMGKADINLLAKEREHYFNSIVGQGRLFWLGTFNENNPTFSGYFDLGANASIESDQKFDVIDNTAGMSSVLRLKNPVTTNVQECVNAIVRPFGSESKRAGLAPVLIVGYDYVNHAKQDANVDTGDNRAKGNFYWTLHIFERQQIPFYSTSAGYDADFVIAVETIYDLNKSEFLNNSKLTLDISPHKEVGENADDKSPSFTLTYAQGKATPTFKHFDAFLAGIKVPF